MSLDSLVGDAQITAVVCNQFGDTGKGKITDYLAENWAEVNSRGTGGDNAGHTVEVKGKKRIFHLLPAGITQDSRGQHTILGNGMVINLAGLNKELDELDAENLTYNNLMISEDANVIMPYHVAFDRANDQSQKGGGIGSTGRGIGPVYSDKIARRGITIRDLFDKDILAKKMDKAIKYWDKLLPGINRDEIIDQLQPHAERIKPFVGDTITEMHNFVREGKKILIEGAQGLLLSVEYGVHPYVTSSDCSINGTAGGVGLSARQVDKAFGIVKFPFMTRVGGGPFPTEFGGKASEDYCALSDPDGKPTHGKERELAAAEVPFENKEGNIKYDHQHPNIIKLINSGDPFERGLGIRLAANEYGATTTRPRRIGATDAVAIRYAVGINGPLIILTKPDSISGADKFDICYGYNLNGEKRAFSRSAKVLSQVTPVNRTYSGYGNINHVRDYRELPVSLREAVVDFEAFTGGRVVAMSVGPERDETIIR